jgi:hypothetical protein
VAERPIPFGNLYAVDEDVLRTHAGVRGKALDDALVKRLLLLDGARAADDELNDDGIVARSIPRCCAP